MQVMNRIINTNPDADRSNGNGHNIQWNARKPYGTHDKTSCKKIRNHANQS